MIFFYLIDLLFSNNIFVTGALVAGPLFCIFSGLPFILPMVNSVFVAYNLVCVSAILQFISFGYSGLFSSAESIWYCYSLFHIFQVKKLAALLIFFHLPGSDPRGGR
jgi:hypothetical protein